MYSCFWPAVGDDEVKKQEGQRGGGHLGFGKKDKDKDKEEKDKECKDKDKDSDKPKVRIFNHDSQWKFSNTQKNLITVIKTSTFVIHL